MAKKATKTKGFVVYNQYGPKELVIESDNTGKPNKGLLYLGSVATLFKTRSAARAAIKRSYAFAKVHNWLPENAPAWYGCQIVRVV
jgi:hypothetical protein